METESLMPQSSNRLLQLSGNASTILNLFSLFPKKVELQALMKYYDANGDGSISYDEYISGLR